MTKITNDASGNYIVFNSPGMSQSQSNNPSDFPATSKTGPTQVTVKITGTQGQVVRFSNPS